jgi:hypothetical protein
MPKTILRQSLGEGKPPVSNNQKAARMEGFACSPPICVHIYGRIRNFI